MTANDLKIRWKASAGDPRITQVRQHANGVVWLSFEPLDRLSWLMNAFSTRLGGVSEGFLGQMNLSFSRGDEESNVRENFERFARAAGFKTEDIVMSDQTHTTNVRVVTRTDCGAGITRPKGWTDVDGFITDEPGVVLSTYYADCVPLYIVDPVRKAIGLSHSGWKGTAGRMGEVTVRAMTDTFGSNPSDLAAVIGPSICQDCYEVGEDVALRFPDDCLILRGGGKYQLDLAEANFRILKESGIRPDRIFKPEICTACNPGFLFSHRASRGRRGNLGAFLMIR